MTEKDVKSLNREINQLTQRLIKAIPHDTRMDAVVGALVTIFVGTCRMRDVPLADAQEIVARCPVWTKDMPHGEAAS